MRNFEDLIAEINAFIFIEDEPFLADAILVAGASDSLLALRAGELYKNRFAPLILVSGRFAASREALILSPADAQAYPGNYATEADFLAHILKTQGVPAHAILKENQARYTQQNAQFSRALLDAQGLKLEKALLVCRPPHARRAWIYYQIAFPETEFAICPTRDPLFNRHTWPHDPQQFAQVMRELGKCGSQTAADLCNALGLADLA